MFCILYAVHVLHIYKRQELSICTPSGTSSNCRQIRVEPISRPLGGTDIMHVT